MGHLSLRVIEEGFDMCGQLQRDALYVWRD